MQESLRRQYLALLGVDLWLPRSAGDPESSADAVPAAPALPVTGPRVAVADAAPMAAAPAPLVPSPRIVEEAKPVPQGPGVVPPVATATPAAVSGTPDRIGCSLLTLPDGLLVIAAYIKPDAPGLGGPEYALLASIAAALAPGAALPSADDFRWPPPGVQLPEVLRAGAGSDALVGLLAEQRRKLKLRDVLLLGEAAAAPVSAACTRLGLNLVMTASLAAMLADPAHKRACWDAAKVLRRG